jgi:hypothetical protein
MKKKCESFHRFNEDNKLHCEDGPAVQYSNGDRYWFLNGVRLSEAEWMRKTGRSWSREKLLEKMKAGLELLDDDVLAEHASQILKREIVVNYGDDFLVR